MTAVNGEFLRSCAGCSGHFLAWASRNWPDDPFMTAEQRARDVEAAFNVILGRTATASANSVADLIAAARAEKAERAWDEGYQARGLHVATCLTAGPRRPDTPNPYRVDAGDQPQTVADSPCTCPTETPPDAYVADCQPCSGQARRLAGLVRGDQPQGERPQRADGGCLYCGGVGTGCQCFA